MTNTFIEPDTRETYVSFYVRTSIQRAFFFGLFGGLFKFSQFFYPFMKHKTLDLPKSIEDRAIHLFDFNFGKIIYAIQMLLYWALDLVQSPGGWKIDETTLQNLEDQIDAGDWNETEWYVYNLYNKIVYTEPEGKDNITHEDGYYRVKHAILDGLAGVVFMCLCIIGITEPQVFAKIFQMIFGTSTKVVKSLTHRYQRRQQLSGILSNNEMLQKIAASVTQTRRQIVNWQTPDNAMQLLILEYIREPKARTSQNLSMISSYLETLIEQSQIPLLDE